MPKREIEDGSHPPGKQTSALRDRLRQVLEEHMLQQKISAGSALGDITADLRHLAIEFDADYEEADEMGYAHFAEECDLVTDQQLPGPTLL